MHANETFAVTWDPHRLDWQTTRNYVEQFLKDVADGSSCAERQLRRCPRRTRSPVSTTTPAAVPATSSATAAAAWTSASRVDPRASLQSAVATGPGHNDANGSDCPVSGTNYFWQDPSGAWGTNANAYCITDDQIRTEVSQMVSDMGLIGRTQNETSRR